MTGKTLPVVTNKDKGIVLTTLRNAPPEVQNDPEVKKALQNFDCRMGPLFSAELSKNVVPQA